MLKKSYTRTSTLKRKPENLILENFLKDIGIDDECSDIDEQVYIEQGKIVVALCFIWI